MEPKQQKLRWPLLPLWLLKKNQIIKGGEQDLTDEYLRIGETITIESFRAFVKAIIEVFGDWYLRATNEADIC